MTTAFVLIATGTRYHSFVDRLLNSMRNHLQFPYKVFLWTDSCYRWKDVCITRIQNEGFPKTTLHRYHSFLLQKQALSAYDQIFYCDVDMEFVSQVQGEDIWSTGITATIHPGFVINREHLNCPGTYGTPEWRTASTAYIKPGAASQYYCGGFNGGASQHYLAMAEKIKQNVDVDHQNGLTALWHDESHLNRYLYDNPPTKILSPSFCYPEDYDGKWGWDPRQFRKVLVALDKGKNR